MSTATIFLALSDRCLTEHPSRGLDAAIFVALHPEWEMPAPPVEQSGSVTKDDSSRQVPLYTTSLDAAVTLIPADWTVWTLRASAAEAQFVADILRKAEDREDRAQGRASTSALALCVAALEAWAEKAKEAAADDDRPI